MSDLTDYRAFVAVVEEGGLTPAARRLGRSLQSVSRSLAAVEREAGVTLARRTTRRSEPTEAGLAFYERLRPALQAIADAHADLVDRSGRIAGRIRIGAPSLFGPAHLTPVLAAFMARRPGIEIDMAVADAFVDLVAENLDLALRFGDMPDASHVARKLGDLRQAVFAAPNYFAARGRPRRPSHLADHACILRTATRAPASWTFRREGREYAVTVGGVFRSNSAAACNEAAARGVGIARAPLWQIRDLLESGRVALALEDYELPLMPIHLVWPQGAPTARVRALIDHIIGALDLKGL